MHYGEIKKRDIANGPGVRVSLFVSGCRNACPHCFNKQTWDFAYGKPYTEETRQEIISALAPDYISGLTLLGGEPMEPENQEELLRLTAKVREEYPNKDIWCFTGFTLEELQGDDCRARTPFLNSLLSNIDILVDGRYVEEQKNISLQFRGSKNQRVIDLKATLDCGEIKQWKELRR